eukprot:1139520-Pelagomonas_calceolata.AAC.2
MGEWRGRLLDGLLAEGQDASLEGWPTTRQIRISLVAPQASFASSWWGSLLVPALTVGPFLMHAGFFQHSLLLLPFPPHLFEPRVQQEVRGQARPNSSCSDDILLTPCPANPNKPLTSPSHRVHRSMRRNEEVRSSTTPARQPYEHPKPPYPLHRNQIL